MRMHADEIDIPVDRVARLVAMQFPDWAHLPLRRVASSGTDNAIFRLGQDKLVRMPRIPRAVANIAHEQRWLPYLAPLLPVAISTPLGAGKPGESYPWPWAVYDWLPGENPAVGRLDAPDDLTSDLAGLLRALWRVPGADAPRKPALRSRDAQVRRDIAALQDRMDMRTVAAVWEAALQVPDWPHEPVWVHGDLSPGNLLIRDGRLCGVIDFAGAGLGDPGEDLRVAWNLLPAEVRPRFRRALDVDDATWTRGRARALAQALVQLPYYWDTNPPLAANARHVVAEIVAEAKHEVPV
ncbi:MAG: aminoglycoside phosphotransferase family protein [Rhizobiaceae bacterium]|nr:aminoglycoside phosphotransferase family protein [Rhizobiaceae bacterium]